VDERLGTDDCESLKDRRKPAIQLDKEPAIMVREPDATMEPALQDNQLMSKHRILGLKPLFDLNGEARMARTNHISAIIAPA
jgi:hypothetical protein